MEKVVTTQAALLLKSGGGWFGGSAAEPTPPIPLQTEQLQKITVKYINQQNYLN
jgi:hypothetical protein